MSAFEQYIAICNRCPFRQRICADDQPCACTADGLDVREHAREGHCPQNLYPVPKTTAETIAHGVAGIAKALTGTGGADEQQIKSRLAICSTCEHNILSLGLIYRCDLCGCLTWAKARNLEEKCPAGKW
jgi:hypothetical protein